MRSQAQGYLDSLAFREETLTRFVSKSKFDRYAADSLRVKNLKRDQYAREDHAKWLALVHSDVEKASKSHLTLLGVAMGEELTEPNCREIGIDPEEAAGGQVLTAAGLGDLVRKEQRGGGEARDKSIACYYNKNELESLAWLKLPTWVSLSEGTVRGHVLLGGTLRVREIDDFFKQLTRKYGRPTASETVTFQNTYGARAERLRAEWVLPGVHVRYTPLEGNMERPIGELRVELDAIYRMRQQEQAAQGLEGPQL